MSFYFFTTLALVFLVAYYKFRIAGLLADLGKIKEEDEMLRCAFVWAVIPFILIAVELIR